MAPPQAVMALTLPDPGISVTRLRRGAATDPTSGLARQSAPLVGTRALPVRFFVGDFVCLQRAAKLMVDAGNGGRLIAVTSVHEHQPRVGSGPYDAAKHGLGGLIKTFALELGKYEITANAVAPGEIATPMTGQEDEDPRQADRPGIPLGRPGDAREIAAVIAFLASPEAAYVTGASWVFDGGMLQMGPQAGSHLTSEDWRKP
jgi:NAD(P)-dependent dehydrogenase (short-subunit alcohol dehydrogenase family)